MQPEQPPPRRGRVFDVAVLAVIVLALGTAGIELVGPHATSGLVAATVTPSGSTQSSAGVPSPSLSPSPTPSAARPSPSPAKPTSKPTSKPAAPTTPHVMVIVEENNSYSTIIGNAQLPYVNSLAQRYVLLTNWWGVSHPSEPNYLGMTSGSIWDNPQDLTPQDKTYPGPTIGDQLSGKGIGWKAYMEDMPHACDLTDQYSPGDYDVNHNPFMYFNSIRGNPALCNRDVPFTQFAGDLSSGAAPPFMYVVPNLNDDMHNGTYATADNWLKTQLGKVFASRWYAQGGVVVLTWDEGESAGDQIATIVIASRLAGHGKVGTYGNHFGLLRSIEEIYRLGYLANAASASNGDIKSLL